MRLGARALRKRLHLRSWCHQIQNRIWSSESTYLKFHEISHKNIKQQSKVHVETSNPTRCRIVVDADFSRVWTWSNGLDEKSGPWKVRETTVKNPWKGREKTVKSHQKLAPKFYSFVWVFCSLFTGFSLKSLEPLVISSSLGTYRLEIGWCAAVVAEAVECMWGLAGFPLYMLTYIPRFPRSTWPLCKFI